ncbi:transposase [Clostridia bacterium]|nr:transposase [Clostridia bacterium]
MQDEVNDKTINLCVQIAKLTTGELKKAAEKMTAELTKPATGKDGKTTELKHGKQTMKQLDRHNAGRSSIELTDPNLRLLKREMNKKSVDFAVEKSGKGKYLLFFKGNDADAMTQAFNSYTQKLVKQAEKPSIKKTLSKMKAAALEQNAGRDKDKHKSRGREL